jgi:hypothetical protein
MDTLSKVACVKSQGPRMIEMRRAVERDCEGERGLMEGDAWLLYQGLWEGGGMEEKEGVVGGEERGGEERWGFVNVIFMMMIMAVVMMMTMIMAVVALVVVVVVVVMMIGSGVGRGNRLVMYLEAREAG